MRQNPLFRVMFLPALLFFSITSFAQIPAAPSLLTGKILAENVVELSWADNASTGEGYMILRSSLNYETVDTVIITAPNIIPYRDTIRMRNPYEFLDVEYYYQVYSKNGFGLSSPSNKLTATVGNFWYCQPDISLDAPITLNQLNFGAIQYSGANDEGGYYKLLNQNTNLSAGQSRNFTISFKDRDNTLGYITDVAVYLDWNNNGYFSDAGEMVYNTSGLSPLKPAEFKVTVPAGVIEGSIIRLRVRIGQDFMGLDACDEAVVIYDFTVNIIGWQGNRKPGNLSAQAFTASSNKLFWADNAVAETGYLVKRSLDGVNFTTVATLPANSVSYLDNGLAPATKYYYYVVAISADANDPSDIVDVSTLPVDFTRQIQQGFLQESAQSLGGVFWGDYNNDGKYDVYSADEFSESLYESQPGKFVQTLNEFKFSQYAAWADFDNDGDQDILVCSDNLGQLPSWLFENDDNGNFLKKDFASADGMSNGVWFDYNKDGFADFIMGGSQKLSIYRNNGDKTFSEIKTFAGITGFVSLADYDGDGDEDLFVEGKAFQLQDTTFTRNAGADISITKFSTRAGCWSDMNNDGLPDLCMPNAIYLNTGGQFIRKGLPAISYAASIKAADFDNDGYNDLVISSEINPAYLILNTDTGFALMPNSIFTNNPLDIYGSANIFPSLADFDNDGFVDVFVARQGQGFHHLFKNNTNGNHWINILLKGTTSNSNAFGTRIRAKSSGKWQYQWLQSNANSAALEFGFGNATQIDSLEIIWPLGYRQSLINISVDQFLTIMEPANCAWTGAASNAWENPANWRCQETPAETSNVIIPANANVIINSNVIVKSLQVNESATVKINSPYTIKISP